MAALQRLWNVGGALVPRLLVKKPRPRIRDQIGSMRTACRPLLWSFDQSLSNRVLLDIISDVAELLSGPHQRVVVAILPRRAECAQLRLRSSSYKAHHIVHELRKRP